MSNAVTEAIKDLFAAYPHFKPPDPERTLAVYVKSLSRLEDYELRAAVDFLLEKGGRFFPTISDIRKAADQLQTQPPRRVDWTAKRAELERRAWAGEFDPGEWEDLERELRHVGRDSVAELVHQKRVFFEYEETDTEQYRRDVAWIDEAGDESKTKEN